MNKVSREEVKKNGISVIDNDAVFIPKTIPAWNYIPPKLLGDMERTFTHKNRGLLDARIDDFYGNLKQCTVDKQYYYNKFSKCPFCDTVNEDSQLIKQGDKI